MGEFLFCHEYKNMKKTIYQIRWNIKVFNKECKQYLGLGKCLGKDFDEQIADCTLCFLTYITMALEKRFSEYETMGELFNDMEEDLMEASAGMHQETLRGPLRTPWHSNG